MPIRVDLLALEPNVPGKARLTVKKWQGGEEQLEFSIQRNQDGFYLQDHKAWSNNPFWFKVSRFNVTDSGDGLEAQVGPDVVDPLLEGGANSQFQIELREQSHGHTDKGVVRPGVGVLPSTAGGQTRSTYGGAELTAPSAPAPAPEILEIPELPELVLSTAEPEVELESVPHEPDYAPPPPPVKKSNKGLIGLLVVVLLLLAAGGGFWFYKRTPAPAPVAANPAAAPAGEKPKPVAEADSGTDGAFSMKDVPAGDYVVMAAMKGQGGAREKVSVKAGETAQVTLNLKEHKGGKKAPAAAK